MDLHERSAQHLPTVAGDFRDVAVFVRYRPRRTKTKAFDRNAFELSLVIYRRLLGCQLRRPQNVRDHRVAHTIGDAYRNRLVIGPNSMALNLADIAQNPGFWALLGIL